FPTRRSSDLKFTFPPWYILQPFCYFSVRNKSYKMKSRRTFIREAGFVSLGFIGLHRFSNHFPIGTQKHGYGPLLDDPDRLLLLPRGYTYKIISRKGDRIADRFLGPGLAGGMPAREVHGTVPLVLNHQVRRGGIEQAPYCPNAELLNKMQKNKIYAYGRGEKIGLGGTTNVVFADKKQE